MATHSRSTKNTKNSKPPTSLKPELQELPLPGEVTSALPAQVDPASLTLDFAAVMAASGEADSLDSPAAPAQSLPVYELLFDLLDILNNHSGPEQMVHKGLSLIGRAFRVEYALLLQHEPRSNSLLPLHPIFRSPLQTATRAGSHLETMRISLAENSTGARAFNEGLPLFANRLEAMHINPAQDANLPVRNALALPLGFDKAWQGELYLLNKIGAGFGDHDLQNLLKMQAGVATLLKNVKLANLLEMQQRRHLAVLEAAVDGYLEVTPDLKISSFSKGAEILTGWTAEEALGHTCQEVLLPHSTENVPLCLSCPLQRAFRTGAPVSNIETLLKNREGEDNWVSCSYNSVTSDRGQIVSGIIAIKDIYRLKALSDELRQQSQQQESLLGVNNAINGLSNIEEIYRVSLDQISKAINFDLGTIHSINAETGQLSLISILEKEGLVEQNYQAPAEPASPDNANSGPGLNLPRGGLGIDLDEESLKRLLPAGPRRELHNSATYLARSIPGYNFQPHQATECEALHQNEPYMSVNLPGKPVCGVIGEFKGLQSHLCVPIKTNDHTYSVLHLASLNPYAFWGSDFVLALSICKQIGVAAERARLFEQVDRLARTDALTGLYNKREFWERVEREIRRAERRETPLSMMIIDLDRLKWINDSFGHSQGDLLLMRLGELIRIQCRASDIAFRYGGDELCILLPDSTIQETKSAADRLRLAARSMRVADAVDSPNGFSEITITMSIGIASYPADARNAVQLFESADAAMYRAKQSGKDRACVFEPQLDAGQNNRRRINETDQADERLIAPRLRTTGLLSGEVALPPNGLPSRPDEKPGLKPNLNQ